MKAFCIAILSFNRPHYLEQVLESLSKNYFIDDLDIYFFQDGPINLYSGIRYASDEDISSCLDLFKRYFPKGIIFSSTTNLGIALNFDRAEKYLFRVENYKSVLFLEDDMILRPNYISIIKYMLSKYGEDERIGMMAAYGADPLTPIEIQKINRNRLAIMHHNWSFCLTKKFWERRQELMEEYLAIISNSDYRLRNHKKISEWHNKLGSKIPQTSQDGAKIAVTNFLGGIRITCFPNNAKYIGKIGVHMQERDWIKRNYDHQVLFDEEIDELEDLTEELYNNFLLKFE